jgi:hypothetical protein
MADPRLAVGFKEIGAVFASFKIDDSTITYSASYAGGSAAVGKAVKLSADDTIALATDGSAVIGKLISVESDGIATVQIAGGMTLPAGDGASLTLGKKIVGAVDGSSNPGYIREVNTSTAAELGVARGFIIDNDDTTAVEVYL